MDAACPRSKDFSRDGEVPQGIAPSDSYVEESPTISAYPATSSRSEASERRLASWGSNHRPTAGQGRYLRPVTLCIQKRVVNEVDVAFKLGTSIHVHQSDSLGRKRRTKG